MTQCNLVFLLEEKSAKAMLSGVLQRISPDTNSKFLTFEGKNDLINEVRNKIQNYKVPNTHFFIVCDQDKEDCKTLKSRLSTKINGHENTTIRIACQELESFYLGDLNAAKQVMEIGKVWTQESKKFREPDLNREKPSLTLKRITNKGYQKVAHSKKISEHLDLEGNNRSHSFNVLISSIKKVLQAKNNHGTA